MNRKLSFVIVIAFLALLGFVVSVNGAIAGEISPPMDKVAAPLHPLPCTANPPVTGFHILGQVFDEQNHTAREGLSVQAVGPDGRLWGETRIRASGQYALPSLPDGQYTLRVLDERGRPLPLTTEVTVMTTENRPWARRDLFLASAQADPGPLEIEQTGQITGIVTALDTGLPIDVGVTVYDATTGSYEGYGWTDSNGVYTVDSLATGSYKIRFSPYSYGASRYYIEQYYNNQASLDSATPVAVTDGQITPNINAVLQPGGQITGRVTATDTHNPLEDVSVYVRGTCPDWFGYTAYTDANGVYTVTAIPTGNNYKVEFDPSYSSSALTEEYIGQYYNNKPDSSSATLVPVTAPNVVNNINAALQRGGQIKGVVTNQSSVGLAAVNVTASGNVYYSYVYATTDATGAYTLTGLVSDTYRIEFTPSGYGVSKDYAYQYYNTKSTWTTANLVTVTAPNVTSNINQILSPGSRITGHVTTADTASPMESASIYVYDSEGDTVSYPSTDASGIYTTTALPTGSYRIRFNPSYAQQGVYIKQYYNNKPTLTLANAVNVTAPNWVNNINAALARGGQISGTLMAADTGLPLSGFYVSVYNSSGDYVSYATTDATGAYLTPALPAGDYRVRFEGRTFPCSSVCYTGQYYNNKSTLGTATVINVVTSRVSKNINGSLATCVAEPTAPGSVTLSGPVTGTAYSNVIFNAVVSPGNTKTPVTYTWQATGKSPVMHTGNLTDTISFAWPTTGTKTITVTAMNSLGSVTNNRTVLIEASSIIFDHRIYLPVIMRQ